MRFLITYGGEDGDVEVVRADSAEGAANQFFSAHDQHHSISIEQLIAPIRYFKRSVAVVEVTQAGSVEIK